MPVHPRSRKKLLLLSPLPPFVHFEAPFFVVVEGKLISSADSLWRLRVEKLLSLLLTSLGAAANSYIFSHFDKNDAFCSGQA